MHAEHGVLVFSLNDICLTLLGINSKELTWSEILEGEMKVFVGDFRLQQKQAKAIPFLLTEAFIFVLFIQ